MARSTFWSQNVQNTRGSDDFWKLRCRKSARRCGAKHISKSKSVKNWRSRTTFGSSDVEKVHAVVARSTFRSENVQNTTCSRHFWRFRCRFAASLHYTTLHYVPLHHTRLYYTTLHYTTLHNTTTTTTQLDYTPLHSTTLNFTTLHYTTLSSTTLHYIKLHYTPLHYITLHYAPQHYNYNCTTTFHYTPLH